MKKITLAILVIASILFTSLPAAAQESPKTRIIAFVQEAKDAGNVAFSLSPCYAPELKDRNGKQAKFGASVALTYTLAGDLGKFTFAGVRLDYLGGEFWAPSISGGLKADVQVWGHNFTPIAFAGAVFPLASLQDQTGSVGTITGAGIKTDLWHGTVFKKEIKVFAAIAVEKWNMTDGHNFDGPVYRGLLGARLDL